MFNVFDTALSALSSISTAVSVVGNNLANLNTSGFKADTVQFHDLMEQQIGMGQSPAQIGMGVSAPDTVRHFKQGTIQQTSGPLDAAIDGQGFFVVRDAQGRQLFTRDGSFTVDTSGHLLTQTGQFVQGWSAAAGTVNANASVSDIVIPVNGVNAAVPTTDISASINLNSAAATGAAGSYSAPIQIVDSLGAVHTLSITFTKTAANSWDYAVTIPAADLASGGSTSLGTGTLTFDGTGALTSPAATAAPVSLSISGFANGAANQTITWDLYKKGAALLTQFAQASGVSAIQQDGIPAGQITSVGIESGGKLVAHYSSGIQQVVGQIALAAITNPETMAAVGNNNLMATTDTAAPAIGTAGSGGRGSIEGSSLESSTVDIAAEFTNLITLQRSYSANSRVITTGDEMLQDLMNIKR